MALPLRFAHARLIGKGTNKERGSTEDVHLAGSITTGVSVTESLLGIGAGSKISCQKAVSLGAMQTVASAPG